MATPHNSAEKGQIAKIVLMPGDPLRAKYLAENFLENPKCFNTVRNMFGYTGTYQGKEISIMGGGMGVGSIGIYSYELFKFYDVDLIIRIGSTGSYDPDLHIYDVVIGDSAWSESTYAMVQGGEVRDVLYPDAETNAKLKEVAKELNINLKPVRVHSADVFYREDYMPHFSYYYDVKGCSVVEMEAFALFHNANVTHKKAAVLLTVSDSMITHQETTPEEREKSFTDMFKVALGIVHKM